MTQRRLLRTIQSLALFLGLLLVAPGAPLSVAAAPSQAPSPVRWAYYVPWDAASLTSLQEHLDRLDYVSPFWYHLGGDGTIVRDEHKPEVTALIKKRGVRVVPTVKNAVNYAAFQPVLARPEVRQRALDTIVALVEERGYDGIHIDFELLLAEDRSHLTAFMAELAARLRPKGKLVSQALAAKERERFSGVAGAFDYAALAQHNDLLLLMAYGFKVSGSPEPGSTAPVTWVDAVAAYAASQIPASKLLLGVPWWAYDWNTATGPPATALRYRDAVALAERHGASIRYDEGVEGATFQYVKDGQRHEVWLENSRSHTAKLGIMRKYGLAGFGGWRLGHEDPGVWEAPPDRPTPVASTWLLAEGSTGPPFHTWILVMNPSSVPANITATFMRENGRTEVRQYLVAPTSRFSIFANQVVPNAAIATKVEADQPVYVERAMYFGHDGHAVAAVAQGSPRWYLPEGFTGPGVDTWILVMNPNREPASVTVTFLKDDGRTVTQAYGLPPTTRLNIYANPLVPNAAFATRVEADRPVVAERAMYFDRGRGGHGSSGAPNPSQTWYFAEGSSAFSTWLLLMNPNPEPAQARITFWDEKGRATTREYRIGPTSRFTLHVNREMGPNLAFGAKIEADRPLVAERAMYWNGNTSGHSSLGVPQPAKVWLFPEGSTAPPFHEWVLLLNPNSVPAPVTLTFMRQGGGTVVHSYELAPTSRFSLFVNQVVPNAHLSLRVESDQPIVAERSMYFGGGGHNSTGFPQ